MKHFQTHTEVTMRDTNMEDQSPPPDDLAIKTVDLRKEYDRTTALKSLDLTIPRGEIYAYLGPNGAGKTTTIKLLSGLINPTRGSMYLCGIDVLSEPVNSRKQIAYVPDQPYIYDKLTGREFLEFVGDLYHVPQSKVDHHIEEYTEVFDMGDYLDSLGETYSHGMKQRVVLSATFLHDPDVILIDEPLVGLDPESSRKVREIFREKSRNDNLTVFMSTHVLSIAEEISDRIGVLSEGELIAQGTMEELQDDEDPAESLEALFLSITDSHLNSSVPSGENRINE